MLMFSWQVEAIDEAPATELNDLFGRIEDKHEEQ